MGRRLLPEPPQFMDRLFVDSSNIDFFKLSAKIPSKNPQAFVQKNLLRFHIDSTRKASKCFLGVCSEVIPKICLATFRTNVGSYETVAKTIQLANLGKINPQVNSEKYIQGTLQEESVEELLEKDLCKFSEQCLKHCWSKSLTNMFQNFKSTETS